jgi:hypothetical protein
MSVTNRARFAVLKRDGFACRYCGATSPDARLSIDHVIPRSGGGSDTEDNLVAACYACNIGKMTRDAVPPPALRSAASDSEVVEALAHALAALDAIPRDAFSSRALDHFRRALNVWRRHSRGSE